MNYKLFSGSTKKALFSYLLLLLYCLVLTTSVTAQNFIYAKDMSDTIPLGGDVICRSVKADNLGNTYITGSFIKTADFDPGAGTANLTSTGGANIFIAKYNASGSYVYAKAIGGSLLDLGQAGLGIAVDGLGNAYVTGTFTGKVDFDPGAGTANLSSAGGEDIFIARYDAAGNYVYAKSIGGANDDVGKSIAVDASDNIYITGTFFGPADFYPGAGIANLNVSGAFVAKYDGSGNYVYAKGIEEGTGNGIAVDGLGNVYITGYASGTVDFDPGPGVANLTSAGSNYIFIAKYDGSGSYLYAKGMAGMGDSGDGNDGRGNSIAVDGSGNTYITGQFNGMVDFDPGAAVVNLTGAAIANIFVAKYDAAGNYVYANSIGETGINVGNGIAVDPSGNAFITGIFAGTADFDPGAGVADLNSNAGSIDIFVAGYDASGNYMYGKAMGGANGDNGYGIALDDLGNTYNAGSFAGTADFDPAAGTANLITDGTNAFVCSLNSIGSYLWADQLGNYSSIPLTDGGKSIAVDALGTTYVTGYFWGTLDFDPGPGTAYLTSAGDYDIFIAKYDASGSYVYAKGIGGTGADFGNAIAIDGLGNVYITGRFQGTADFNPGPGIVNLVADSLDIFIAKYDVSGNYIYAKGIGGPGEDIGLAITVDGTGSAYITGYFAGTVNFNPAVGVANLTSAGNSDIFVARYDAAGNYVYAKNMGGNSYAAGESIAVDGSGNAYISGEFFGTVDFDPGAGVADLTAAGNSDSFIAKYDASGNYVYAKSMQGADYQAGFGIAVDGSGSAYVTGYFSGTVDFDPGSGVADLTAASTDIYVAKYDASGNYVYAKAIGGPSVDVGLDIAVDGSGNAYVTGYFHGTADFDPGPGVVNLTSLGVSDVFVASYDASGNYVYAKAIGGTDEEGGNGIAVDISGNAYVTGYFSQTADFDRGGSSPNSILTTINGQDIFIAKYGSIGAVPVKLVNFYAKTVNNEEAVLINWTTTSQVNNAYFEVERSTDGINFAAIGRKQGCFTCWGLQKYELTDSNPYFGVSYYRLKQVDFDNKFSYSPIAIIKIANWVSTSLYVYPTVTKDVFQVRIKNNRYKKQAVIRLFNTAGSLIKQQAVWLEEGDNTFNYSLFNQPRGVYYISLADKKSKPAAAVSVIKK